MFLPPVDPPKTTAPSPAHPRHAEATDTRQAIRHHEHTTERRKDDSGGGHGAGPFDGEDAMTLSVSALIEFLQTFIATHGLPSGDAPAPASTDQVSPVSPALGANPASQAASAYTHASKTQVPQAGPAAPPIGAEDLPDIRRAKELIQSLRRLAARGVSGVTFTPQGNFLDSLARAIEQTG